MAGTGPKFVACERVEREASRAARAQAGLHLARVKGATLIIAKLDRLLGRLLRLRGETLAEHRQQRQ